MNLLRPLLTIFGLVLAAASAHAQTSFADLLRTNPKFLQTFRAAVAKPAESTVRVKCDGKDTALGLIVAADGWVLTKAHDLRGRVECILKDGRELEARIVGVHAIHDLAMLKVEASGLSAAVLTESKGVPAGSWVASPGVGADPVAVGVVSVPTREVVFKGLPYSAAELAKAGFLGVGLEPAETGGVRVVEVMPNTAAARAGLKINDVIVRVGDQAVSNPDEFMRHMVKRRPGDEVTFRVRRAGSDLDVTAKLQQRPSNGTRADLQNHMGSELSARRAGYPTVLQHDSVLKPADCGGPLVDLDGNILGINICRAGRVETFAIPTEVINAVLPELKSGKRTGIDTPAVKPAATSSADVDALLSALNKRLSLMESVARAKWNAKRPIADPAREQQVIDAVVRLGARLGVNESDARRLITAQLAASKQVQENLFADWQRLGIDQFRNVPDLQNDLRPQIDQATQEVFAAYARLRPQLASAESRKLLRDRSPQLLIGAGIDDAVRTRALEGLVK